MDTTHRARSGGVPGLTRTHSCARARAEILRNFSIRVASCPDYRWQHIGQFRDFPMPCLSATPSSSSLIPARYTAQTSKALNKVSANRTQQYAKKAPHHGPTGFIQGMKGWPDVGKWVNIMHHVNRKKDKVHVTISINAAGDLTNFYTPLG